MSCQNENYRMADGKFIGNQDKCIYIHIYTGGILIYNLYFDFL